MRKFVIATSWPTNYSSPYFFAAAVKFAAWVNQSLVNEVYLPK
ncbi:hypothetical protein [Arthrobacter sp. M2012083]|nr:hypothetical protein [Arthrobacter sp. M2012083]